MKRVLILLLSHGLVGVAGFALGVFLLPVLTATPPPTVSEMVQATEQSQFTGYFKRNLKGSDFLHWGSGTLKVGPRFISFEGKLAPGPAYKLYLSPVFVETEIEFNHHKSKMVQVGNIGRFEHFVLPVPKGVEPEQYQAAIVWCESFSEFITAARYQ